jgi:Arc/MetJ-type ribon-helix-helix transcriptional regulator
LKLIDFRVQLRQQDLAFLDGLGKGLRVNRSEVVRRALVAYKRLGVVERQLRQAETRITELQAELEGSHE